MIRHRKGFERLRILFTGLRGYLCRDCDTSFRAPDRRQVAREGRLQAGVVARQA
jgi:transposase